MHAIEAIRTDQTPAAQLRGRVFAHLIIDPPLQSGNRLAPAFEKPVGRDIIILPAGTYTLTQAGANVELHGVTIVNGHAPDRLPSDEKGMD